MYNGVAENVLGTMGTIFWCIQLIPQIVHNYKRKDCEGLPPSMMFLWALSGIPFSIYFVGTDGSIPLRIQPQLFTLFCTISWSQTLYYPPVRLPKWRLVAYVGSFLVVALGLEFGFIFWLRPVYRHGTHWPMLVVGIVASVLLAIGLLPPYFEIWKRRGRVYGINFFFLSMDSAGALLSMISIIVGTMDIMSMVLYAIVLFLEMGIFLCQIVWYLAGGRQVIKKEKAERKEAKNFKELDLVKVDSDENTTYDQAEKEETSPNHV
ncbi:PQ-loop-domain-containing protein [Hyphopichia burtonii NRRL Y-1933]|uniref:PQ-loop-domain-containing protein n=1 Tax=Hyphopichia burtonii NRRL Y-1933 TaxID=984485 RepID=A0A1E4RHH7_9ASCO|nr:PQ-loop-domain-containing protein [Hyphopichia burtonii NRRL Y-1933]ODV66671.1 PQ-loop-domain-containing protein [Hyphopichia burtonii NRRL Y-1933]